MKKRFLVLMLVLAMALCAFVACGGEEEAPGTESSGTGTGTSSSKPTEIVGGDEDCEHAWVSEGKTAATCAEEGFENFACTKCGATKKETLPKNNDHKYKVTEEIAATCQEFSKTTKVCERCGDTQVVEGDTKASHKGVEKVTLEATCVEDGQRDYVCDVCGTTMYKAGLDKVIPKLGHSYEREGNEFSAEAGVTFIAGNCDTEGYFNRVCVDCGYDQDPITREEYGAMSSNPNYDATKYDSMEIWGHAFETFVRSVDATCTVDGYDEYKCSRCDAVNKVVNSYAEGHTYFKEASAVENEHFVITQQPTCITEGKKAYKCTVCGENATDDANTEAIPTVPHDTSNRDAAYLVKDVAADCTVDAYKVYKCCVDTFCTETATVYDEGTALGHNPVVNGEQTCKTEGKTPYKCDRCSEEWLDGPVNENIKHQALPDKVSEATCITNAVYKCSVCDKEFGPYEDDAAYADGFAHGIHVFQYSETVAPTCSSIGYKIYACVGDGACTATRKNDTNTDMTQPDEPKAEDIVERTPHTFDENGDGTIDVSPDGRVTCAVCFAQYRDVTTEITNGSGTLCLGCGKTPCDCGLSVEWNGYVSPVIPDEHILAANTETVISSVKWTEVEDKGDKALAIGGGVIILDGEEATTYTVKIYDKANGTLLDTVTVTGDSIIDLYKYAEVGQVAITASEIAIVYFYAAV